MIQHSIPTSLLKHLNIRLNVRKRQCISSTTTQNTSSVHVQLSHTVRTTTPQHLSKRGLTNINRRVRVTMSYATTSFIVLHTRSIMSFINNKVIVTLTRNIGGRLSLPNVPSLRHRTPHLFSVGNHEWVVPCLTRGAGGRSQGHLR